MCVRSGPLAGRCTQSQPKLRANNMQERIGLLPAGIARDGETESKLLASSLARSFLRKNKAVVPEARPCPLSSSDRLANARTAGVIIKRQKTMAGGSSSSQAALLLMKQLKGVHLNSLCCTAATALCLHGALALLTA